jgi:hypothetical protein
VLAEVKDFSPLDERKRVRIAAAESGEDEVAAAAGAGGGDFRAVAPPAMSFASGRRR